MAITRLERKRINREKRAEEIRNSFKIVFALTLLLFSLLYLAAILSGSKVLISASKANEEASDDSPMICRYFDGRQILTDNVPVQSCPLIKRDQQ